MSVEFDKLVSKGWGYEKWIVNGDKYCGKILHFVKGRMCSLHSHKLKVETFYVSAGKVIIKYGDAELINKHMEQYGEYYINRVITEKLLEPGDYFHIEPGLAHQVIALQDSEIIEFSTQHFDEDSYRIIKGD